MSGTLTVPNVIASLAGGNQPASLLDDNWNATSNYINVREITSGTFASRPSAAAVGNGAYFWATDINGGTAYFTTGGTWQQLAPGLTEPITTIPGAISAMGYAEGSRAGDYSTTSATFVDVDGANLSVSLTVPVGSAFLIVWAFYAVGTSVITDGDPHVQFMAAGSALGAFSYVNNSTTNPIGVQTVMGFRASPTTGGQTVRLQFKGDGANAFTIKNPAAEGTLAAGPTVVPKMMALCTT